MVTTMMSTLPEARQRLADAVTSAGLPCSPYPTDSPALPAAWVSGVDVVYDVGGWSFCRAGAGTFQIVTVAQRNDVASSLTWLEGLVPAIAGAVEQAGTRITAISSGATTVGGQDLPSVTYAVSAGL